MLAQVVSLVGGARAPVDAELVLLDAVLEPVEAHVDGFRTALFDCAVHDALSAFVVGLDGRDTAWIRFVWSVGTYYVLLSVNGNAVISTFGHAGEISLGEASYFFTIAFLPVLAFAAFT